MKAEVGSGIYLYLGAVESESEFGGEGRSYRLWVLRVVVEGSERDDVVRLAHKNQCHHAGGRGHGSRET